MCQPSRLTSVLDVVDIRSEPPNLQYSGCENGRRRQVYCRELTNKVGQRVLVLSQPELHSPIAWLKGIILELAGFIIIPPSAKLKIRQFPGTPMRLLPGKLFLLLPYWVAFIPI